MDEAALWAQAQTYRIAGRPCLSLDLEDHLLLLCFHAAHHHRFQYVGLRALLDVGQALIQPPRPIDWMAFKQLARDMNWDRGVALMFGLIQDVLGLPVPEELKDLTADQEDAQVRELALQALMVDQNHRECISSEVVKLFNRPTRAEQLRHLRNRLFLPADQIKNYFGLPIGQPLGRLALLALHLRRWRSLLHNNASALLRLWRGDPNRKAELERSGLLQKWLEGGRDSSSPGP